jgi:hypothetical protein
MAVEITKKQGDTPVVIGKADAGIVDESAAGEKEVGV